MASYKVTRERTVCVSIFGLNSGVNEKKNEITTAVFLSLWDVLQCWKKQRNTSDNQVAEVVLSQAWSVNLVEIKALQDMLNSDLRDTSLELKLKMFLIIICEVTIDCYIEFGQVSDFDQNETSMKVFKMSENSETVFNRHHFKSIVV